ncbi:TPA: hypothetical protein MDW71_005281 [Klebsiella pneumoniae]|nr:hypothetical protein [Klebsiella pneumoniae]
MKRKSFIRWVNFGSRVFVIAVIVAGFYYCWLGIFGVSYNPVLYYSAELFNHIWPGAKFPVTFLDSKLYFDNGTYAIGSFILSAVYLIVISYAQVYVAVYIARKLADILVREVVIYKEGKAFYKKYAGINNVRIDRVQSEKSADLELEDVSRKHWEKWKEHYKSDMDFDEWKRRFNKVL